MGRESEEQMENVSVARKSGISKNGCKQNDSPLVERCPNVVENRQISFDFESDTVEFLTMKLLASCIFGFDIPTKLGLHSTLEGYIESAPPEKQQEMRHKSVELTENFIDHCKDYCKRFNHITFGIIDVKERKK